MCSNPSKTPLNLRGDKAGLRIAKKREALMGIYKDVYDFAAKAGSLEGYVYPEGRADLSYLPNWTDNLVKLYGSLPREVKEDFQGSCNVTIGRSIQCLVPALGEDHEVIKKLKSMISGPIPDLRHKSKR
jgi:hypothetical protein